mmetsp:Transcript_35591/g.79072  ORF Transcript_35591/g.79072 Transcript_35591/m.79072 type:complete len:110 (-) Transcript_35591:2990-3319(-)
MSSITSAREWQLGCTSTPGLPGCDIDTFCSAFCRAIRSLMFIVVRGGTTTTAGLGLLIQSPLPLTHSQTGRPLLGRQSDWCAAAADHCLAGAAARLTTPVITHPDKAVL